MSGTAQRRLAAFVARASRMSEDARNVARQSLVDSLAVVFAGRREGVHRHVAAYLAGSGRLSGGAPSWLQGTLLTAETAALANATAVHALDYDDVTSAWRGHPGTVIWPALFAVAEPHLAYGEFLDSFVVGFEVGAQIGSEIIAHHYDAGWHATATIGAIAATAACARLVGLDEERTFHALGLAAAQSCGLQGNFGSMAKPLQAGFAASAAVRAALLGRHGVEAGDVLEGRNGFSRLYGAAETLRLSLPAADTDEFAIQRAGIEVKQFPNCYAAHRAVEAALSLQNQLKDMSSAGAVIDVRSIRAVQIEGTRGAHKALLTRLPSSVAESRFSAEYAVACALVDGKLPFSSFTPEHLERPQIRELLVATRVRESDVLGSRRAARVSIELVDGQTLQSTVTSLPGNYGDPTFMRRLEGKVADCMSEAGLERFARPLWDAVIAAPSDQPMALQSSLLPTIWAEGAGRA